jgi:hypothetical protein
MADFLEVDAIVQGILQTDSATKQELGRRFALYLGIQAGIRGADEGIDGWGEVSTPSGVRRIYFQSKLEQMPLDASRAADFYGNLCLHQVDIGVMLSGAGYTSGFVPRLEKDPHLQQRFRIHLLSLADLFGETVAFQRAIADLPPLRNLADEHWRELFL